MDKVNKENQNLQKVHIALITHVYKQASFGIIAGMICATILLIGLYQIENFNLVIIWYLTIFCVSAVRYLFVWKYLRNISPEKNLMFWRRSFIAGAWMAGMCWGFISSVLLPMNNLLQFTLVVLMVAGLTAGAVPVLSGVLRAAIGFLLLALLPLDIRLLLTGNNTLLLFDVALFIYLAFLIVLAISTRKMIASSLSLRFENDVLFENLSTAKDELERINKKLQHAASHDLLMNLPNRSSFQSKLAEAIRHAEETRESLALIYIDVDNLEEVNDTYGYRIGDQVLRLIAQRINKELPPEYYKARFAGDEIVLILERIPDPNSIVLVAQQICKVMNLPFEVKDNNIILTVSMGISIFPVDGRDAESLLRSANKAMHSAKEQEGNYFYFNSDSDTLNTALTSAFPRTDVPS